MLVIKFKLILDAGQTDDRAVGGLSWIVAAVAVAAGSFLVPTLVSHNTAQHNTTQTQTHTALK